MPERLPDSLSPAEALFADWLTAQDAELDVEALCRAHPARAAELRVLWLHWQGLKAVLERVGFGAGPVSLSEKIHEKYGSGVDPNVSLDAGEQAQPPSSALLRRLAEHSLKTTRYKLQGEIARGGMGAILKIWDEDLRRNLAMKVILGKSEPGSSGETPPVDRRLLTRFLEEAQVTGQLDHPGIVPVHELGLDAEGRVFFTMKLVKGRDLKAIFDLVFAGEEGWNETRALGVILKVCEAMAYAHAKGVIHRDLKPANVMVGGFGEVYVMDWGLARVLGKQDTHDLRLQEIESRLSSVKTERREEREEGPDSPIMTMDGDIVGTPAYMPPEQALGAIDKLSPRSDVYAIGAMLYHLLARQMPYVPPGARLSNRTVLAQVVHGPPAAIHSLRQGVPAELEAICDKAMAREPEKRYADTLALAEDLRAFLEGRVVRAYRTGALIELRKWVQRNKALAASLAAAMLLLVAGLSTSLTLGARAERNAVEADRLRQEAVVREESATARADALWAIQELKNFNALDDDLEYARRQDRPTYMWWLEQAHELVGGRPADPARGLRKKPGLADHRRLLAEIRQSARAPTEAELAADRASHPRAKELEAKRAELLWTSRMLGLEPWPSEAEVEAALEREQLPSDADTLNDMAWKLVDPEAPVRGQEMRALAIAQRAVAEAKDGALARYRDTLAWAFLWTGKLDEALAEVRQALAEGYSGKRTEYVARIESLVQPFRDGKARARREVLASDVAALEREVSEPRTLRLDGREKEWWNTHLGQLEQDLVELEQRIALAERSVTNPVASQVWKTGIDAIAASPMYGGLRITPQLELVPLGPDPDSGLWEFAHLGTGEAALRGSDGKLTLKPETGIVFVLLPSGRIPIEDGAKPTPLNEVQLDPFFLSKYEMTVAQWERTSRWTGRFSYDEPLLPANSVSWDDCVATVERAGLFLRLPSEAQWEYGCRAGTTTPWWTGADEEALLDAANIRSKAQESQKIGDPQAIGILFANAFGLHDVHGNEKEWCSDEYGDESVAVRSGDGERVATGSRSRVVRGGNFGSDAWFARSGFRDGYSPSSRWADNGLRVARSVTP